MSVRRCLGSRRRDLFARTRTLAAALDARVVGGAFVEKGVRHSGTLVQRKPDAGAESAWKVVRRPVLDIELRRYAALPVVPQPLLLHGPRGVGKRTAVEGLLEDWSRSPHATAYVDLHAQLGENHTLPWRLSTDGGSALALIRRQVEQGLEALAIRAVQAGCLKSRSVFDALVGRHTIDAALFEFVPSLTSTEGAPGDTKQLWHRALLHMQKASRATSQPVHIQAIAHIDELLLAVQENADTEPLDIDSCDGIGRKKLRNKTGVFDVTEKALLALALAKHLLRIQERWRVGAGEERRRQGVVPRGVVEAAVSWPALLLELLSWATQEGVFQPKLVINGLEVLRNASMGEGGVDGALYHDGLLLHLVYGSHTQGSFPVILVSSDSYYSWQLGDDFGDSDAFISNEIFGWTPKEAALHLVPSVFTADEWKVIVAVLGPNPRHSVELLQLRHSNAYLKRMESDDSLDIEDCIDLYLAYLQVTEVDPAMDTALGLLEEFAEKALKGNIDSNLLQHGAPWRDFPRSDDKGSRHQWAKAQMMDFVQAFAVTEFGVNYLGGDLEFLDDPAARALIKVGLLYQQRAPPFVRPTSRGILRCLTRWFVNQKLHLEASEKLRFRWHRLIRGRSYRHLMRE